MKSHFAATPTEHYIGVMSGTSQDGIDAVLAEFKDGHFQRVIAAHTGRYEPELRASLVELSREATPVALSQFADLDRRVADAFADTVLALVESAGIDRDSIRAVGSHGQTVFHDPDRVQSSLQLGDPSRIAVRTQFAVVADFRRADVALGGQGAPLLPIFHLAMFADAREARAVLNLGGIANLTLLPDTDPSRVRGFDCGPANCLMDEWVERHRHQACDRDGVWAASGSLDSELLALCLADPYFQLAPPKSTGRGKFNLAWVETLDPRLPERPVADVQRTLCELSARTVADSLIREAPDIGRLLVCGGGVRNSFLMDRLRRLLPGLGVGSTVDAGLDPQHVEPAAFAWLACRRMRGEPGNLPSVTGAKRPAVLGGVYAP